MTWYGIEWRSYQQCTTDDDVVQSLVQLSRALTVEVEEEEDNRDKARLACGLRMNWKVKALFMV